MVTSVPAPPQCLQVSLGQTSPLFSCSMPNYTQCTDYSLGHKLLLKLQNML